MSQYSDSNSDGAIQSTTSDADLRPQLTSAPIINPVQPSKRQRDVEIPLDVTYSDTGVPMVDGQPWYRLPEKKRVHFMAHTEERVIPGITTTTTTVSSHTGPSEGELISDDRKTYLIGPYVGERACKYCNVEEDTLIDCRMCMKYFHLKCALERNPASVPPRNQRGGIFCAMCSEIRMLCFYCHNQFYSAPGPAPMPCKNCGRRWHWRCAGYYKYESPAWCPLCDLERHDLPKKPTAPKAPVIDDGIPKRTEYIGFGKPHVNVQQMMNELDMNVSRYGLRNKPQTESGRERQRSHAMEIKSVVAAPAADHSKTLRQAAYTGGIVTIGSGTMPVVFLASRGGGVERVEGSKDDISVSTEPYKLADCELDALFNEGLANMLAYNDKVERLRKNGDTHYIDPHTQAKFMRNSEKKSNWTVVNVDRAPRSDLFTKLKTGVGIRETGMVSGEVYRVWSSRGGADSLEHSVIELDREYYGKGEGKNQKMRERREEEDIDYIP